MSAGSNVTVTNVPLVIFDATPGGADALVGGNGVGPVHAYRITMRHGPALLVHVDGLHAANEFIGIGGYQPAVFRSGQNGITKITVKCESTGAGALIDHGVIERL